MKLAKFSQAMRNCHVIDEDGACEVCPFGEAFNGHECHQCTGTMEELRLDVPKDLEECRFYWPAWEPTKYKFMSGQSDYYDPMFYQMILWNINAVSGVSKDPKFLKKGKIYDFQRAGSGYIFHEKDDDDEGCLITQGRQCNKCKDKFIQQMGCMGSMGKYHECNSEQDLWYFDHFQTGAGWGNLLPSPDAQSSHCLKRSNMEKEDEYENCVLISPNYSDLGHPDCLKCDYRKGYKMCIDNNSTGLKTRCAKMC